MKEVLVTYSHQGTLLEGYLAYDESRPGPLPGVLVAHAWAGRSEFECAKARALAQLGYAGFALDMYGKGVLGTNPDENMKLLTPFMADRALLQARQHAALAALRAQAVVDARRIAAFGYCFGGSCVLDLARTGADVRGVVSLHGLLGKPGNTDGQTIGAKVLVLHGYADPMAPPESVDEFAREMDASGADWQVHMYGGTMHSFTNPEANDPGFGTVYNAAADRRSWTSLVNFLGEVLL